MSSSALHSESHHDGTGSSLPTRILVTGGAGFIGSALVRHLLNTTGCEVINLDALTYAANPASLTEPDAHPRHHFIRADICDAAHLRTILARYTPDAILHLAAESHVDRSIERPDAFIQTNVVGTCTLLNETLRYWQQQPRQAQQRFRFLHVSTDEVFGDLCANAPAADADSRYAPSSPYSASKAGADHLVQAWHRTYGLPTIITYSSNNYGPRQFPEKLIPHMIIRALEGQPLPLYGDGQQVRDWLHVEDHAAALWQITQRGRPGACYTVSAHETCSNLSLTQALCKVLDEIGPPPNGITGYEALIRFVADRPGHDRRYALNASQTMADIGWKPTHSLQTGLRETVRWYLDNPAWWQAITGGDYHLQRQGLGLAGD